MTDGPLIVQSDKTVLLEVDHELAGEARAAIAPFAELERAPEHVHTYRITPLALWNARAAGHDAEQVVDARGVDSGRGDLMRQRIEGEHRSREGASVRRCRAARHLVGAELRQGRCVMDEGGEARNEEQRP